MGNVSGRFKSFPNAKQQESSSSSSPGTITECHYVVLGIAPTSTPEEIKRAYRQKALQLHPDKQKQVAPGKSSHDAAAMFVRLNEAYRVLEDPQERAWYDRHREIIMRRSSVHSSGIPSTELRGDESGMARAQEHIDSLVRFMSATAYSGFGDDKNGFFALFRDVFADIDDFEKEHAVATRRSQDKANAFVETTFGLKNTPYEPTLADFYSHWLSFSTTRSFVSPDEVAAAKVHEYGEQGRRLRRHIAKDLQKQQEALKKRYNETVRALAAFVRKRDPRYKAWMEAKEKARRTAEQNKRIQEESERAAAAQAYVPVEWAAHMGEGAEEETEFLFKQLRHLDLEFSDDLPSTTDKEGTEDEQGEEEDCDFYCVACKKKFSTQSQWKNHEQSKKHKESVIKSVGKKAYKAALREARQQADQYEEVNIEEVSVEQNPIEDTASEEEEETSQSESEHSLEDIDEAKEESEQEKEEEKEAVELKQKKPRRRKDKTKPTALSVDEKNNQQQSADDHTCSKCKQLFPSRNALFAHLKETGHSGGMASNKRDRKLARKQQH